MKAVTISRVVLTTNKSATHPVIELQLRVGSEYFLFYSMPLMCGKDHAKLLVERIKEGA